MRNFLLLFLVACQPTTIKLGKDTAFTDGNGDSATDSSGTGNDSDSGATTVIDDTGTQPATLELTGITPAFGPTDGGTTVTLMGGPFTADAKVGFGTKVATVVKVDANNLVVTSPAQASEGPVDVAVIQGGLSAKLTNAFTYYDAMNGRVAYLGDLYYIHNLSQDLGSDSAGVWTYLVDGGKKTDFWSLYAPKLDSCESDYNAYPAGQTLKNPADVTLQTGAQAKMQIPWDGNSGTWADADIGSGFVEGASYTATFPAVGTWPAAGVSNAVNTPSAFTVTEPSMSRDVPYVDGNNFRVQWTGGKAGDAVLIAVSMFDREGGYVQETVTCAAIDDGSFTIPINAWQNWSSNRWLLVSVTRDIEGAQSLPFNGGAVKISGTYTVQGYGYSPWGN